MSSRKMIIAAVLASVALISCEKDIEFKGEHSAPIPVMYALALADSTMSVSLSNSVFFLDENWGKEAFVSEIKGKTKSVGAFVNGEWQPMSVSGDDPEYMHDRRILYKSTYTPKAGDKVEFKAEFDGFDTVTGLVEIPAKPNVEVLELTKMDNKIILILKFNNITSQKQYFSLNFHNCSGSWGDETDDFSIFGETTNIISTDDLKGENHTYRAEISYWWDTAASIRINALSQSLYYYSMSRDLMNGFGGIFGEGVQLYSNVEGGLGCVFGMTTSYLNLVLPEPPSYDYIPDPDDENLF